MMLETSIVVVIITAFYLISEGLLAHCSTMVLENVTKLALQFNFIVPTIAIVAAVVEPQKATKPR